MASPFKQAQSIFRAIRGNSTLIEAKKAEYIAAATAITSPTGGLQVESATVNGQSFTGKHSSTPSERLEVLAILMSMIERDSAGNRTTRVGFL